MKLTRALIFIACSAMVASAFGQDSLLGKGKKDSPPPKSQSSGSGGHTSSGGSGSSGRSRNNGGGSNDSGTYSAGNSGDQSGNNSSRDPRLQKVLSKKNNQSRSGKVHYGTVNNLINGDAQRLPIQIRQAPIRSEMPMSDKIQRQDQVRARDHRRDNDDRFRVGYYQYGSSWRDDSFSYPYYVFSPYSVNRCVVSPWYYYPFLPGYIETNRIVYTSNYQDSFVGLPFDYVPPSRYRDDQYGDDRGSIYDDNYLNPRNLNFAVDDLINAFTRRDRRAVDRLVPRTGQVALAIDGRTSYGVNADDFYDMLVDAVTSSQTLDYQITAVKSNNEEAEVLATHTFTDPWGRQQYVYHRFHLFGERGNVVIRSFETSANPFW